MTVGDTLTCTVSSLAYGGDGIGRVEGLVLFIPETAPGDTALVRVVQVKKTFARATVASVLAPSPERDAPCCRVPDPRSHALCRVPGCVYDHLSYPAEVRAKTEQLNGFLKRLNPQAPFAALPSVAAPAALHYRNKAVLHAVRDVCGARLGYRQEPSHHVLDIEACPLACDAINTALCAFRRSPEFRTLPPEADVTFRYTPHDGAMWWVNHKTPTSEGPDLLTELSPVGPLKVPRDGFYQVNPAVGDRLVRTAAAWFAEDPRYPEILDLYCGVGVFGFACLAQGGTRLAGVESGRQAVAAARLNAATLGVHASFFCQALGLAPLSLSSLAGDIRRTTVLVDPPREGLAAEMALALAQSGIPRLLYVSCDPATLTRDLAVLMAGNGYRLVRAQLFDMFPRTAHFETLVELIRG